MVSLEDNHLKITNKFIMINIWKEKNLLNQLWEVPYGNNGQKSSKKIW
jgi:hypothetical protein